MIKNKLQVSSGVSELDSLLGGMYIGDNVVWYDDAGNLASVFCLNLIKQSIRENKPVIYVSFDRSPKNLLDKLGDLAKNENLTILDCFTNGKGGGADVFMRFYEDTVTSLSCSIIRQNHPERTDQVINNLISIYQTKQDNVRFIFESLTGMQDLWGNEDTILKFYTHACPRLYDMNTVAYWIIEKNAHSQRLKAGINQIAQVAFELFLKRGKTYLSILKAESRSLETLNKYYYYGVMDQNVSFESGKYPGGPMDLGQRLKEYRTRQSISQTELARLVGVTPSTISQVESGNIYPSLPALFKISETLGVPIGSFFKTTETEDDRFIFSETDASTTHIHGLPKDGVNVKALLPDSVDSQLSPYIIELLPGSEVIGHFFNVKEEEIGYVLSGSVDVYMGFDKKIARKGDSVLLQSEIPVKWVNQGAKPVKILWITVNRE